MADVKKDGPAIGSIPGDKAPFRVVLGVGLVAAFAEGWVLGTSPRMTSRVAAVSLYGRRAHPAGRASSISPRGIMAMGDAASAPEKTQLFQKDK